MHNSKLISTEDFKKQITYKGFVSGFIGTGQLRALMKGWPEDALQIVVDRKDDKDVLTARLCSTD